MSEGVSLDNLIRRSMHDAVDGLEPSAGVREALLAKAASALERSSAFGPAMPPLAEDLRVDMTPEQPCPAVTPASVIGGGQWLLLTTAPLYAVR